jgi:uncharacterized protein (TIRG00374 family)
MVSVRFKVTWKTVILLALGLIAFFVYLYLFNVDIPTIIETAKSINLSLYLLAVAFVVFEALFFSLSWRTLLSFLSVKLSVWKAFLYVWYSVFIDIIIPAESISGEVSRVYLVTREQNGTSGKVVASLVAHRLIGMVVYIASLLVSASTLIIRGQLIGTILNLMLFLAVLTAVFLVLLLLLCVKEHWTLKIVNAIFRLIEYLGRGRWKIARFKEDAVKAARMFHASMKEFWHAPKAIFTSLGFYIVTWLFCLGTSYIVFLSMGFQVHWSVIVVTNSIIVAIKSIPLGVPFEVGLPEITMTTLYMLLLPEIPLQICATATVLTRILTVWLRFFMGFAVQQWLEIKTLKQQT